ncbi:polyadenylate-binding protein 4-like isoform X2 [Tachysurus fulvidraco]|uniref:polyadenylate-binding protein 4-like isoform X1 n=1 Tax=Tachysurus fulvidraco TaxID=1234273 RepID=UPI000F4FC82B|nr:polyadenylate-binding protein 4-like isoform X1 [Tachysurus fulvidraco]XP_047672466.1 polyadenylate-binding protein 4-like isoform X2 [Tachysurus fulvidraco]
MVAVYVGDLHPEVSDLMLLNKFNNAGPIQSVNICKDKETGSPLGYAYVNFYHRADAEQAIKMFNFELLMERPMRVMWSRWEPTAKITEGCNILINDPDPSINGMRPKGRQVTVEYFKSREELKAEDKNQGNNLYIKNLDDNVDNDCLYRTFAQFGTIKSAKVMMENGRSKRFGFVCFTSSQDAMKAMNKMNGMMWGRKKIYVGLAQKKEERQAFLQGMFRKEFSSPAVKTPCSEDLVQTVETAAPKYIVEAVETAAPVNTVEGVETATPVDTRRCGDSHPCGKSSRYA